MIAGALFGSRTKPRSVFCVVEQAHRNRRVAEELCAGRFTHIGITLELGVEPDWLTSDLPPDEEWQIEWHKFYYGLDLAQAFCETGNRKFLETWERLVRSWIKQVPVDFGTSDVAGRRIQNWIYAWNIFSRSPEFKGLRATLAKEIIESITLQISHLRKHLTPERNHRTLELYALLIAALALPEIDPRKHLLRFAVDQLHRNLLTDIRPDGVHREGSTHYHMTALRSFLGARENARRFDLKISAEFDERLERACEFAMYCHRPDGSIPALSDSDTGSYTDLLELAASIFSRPDFLYVATSGVKGVPPGKRLTGFPAGGYYIQRSGWGEGPEAYRDERFLIFDCGPLGDGGHGHYDLLNIEITAHNRPIVIDPGRYTYSEQAPNWRQWFKGTAAHNTVLVDRLNQTPYRRGKPKDRIARGKFTGRLSAPGLDMLCGEARSFAYDAVHTRRIFFVAGRYWIITDYLRSDITHRFDLRFHLSPESLDRITLERRGRNTLVRTPDCAFVWDSDLWPEIEPGWAAPLYGVKVPAPVISVAVEGSRHTAFHTLIYPLTPNEEAPGFQLLSHPSQCDLLTVFEIYSAESNMLAIDLVAWRGMEEAPDIDSPHGRASAAWIRKIDESSQTRFIACQAQRRAETSFREGKPLENLPSVQWITWDEDEGIMPDDGRPL